ncbi:lytic transglycosylase domain-containing protein [Streptacidiphilus jiangxiensis]|uniref:Membrane-bound lytic murein transglycosylase B n=1 Tax=Streptacidiphilus jiangxiensis TaxID=235985 RepID=A0A1H7MTP3_STRJI|nr:lytic transglycosylase domain-containing protein [Streptacidiphilus jiangxiensis]SEL14660.1 Membrane-bound lytic murein transglycosylase B [Streptacidiphilus jiangxiensis]
MPTEPARPTRPLRLIVRRERTRSVDRPRLWCAATTAVGLVALGAVTTSSVPAAVGSAVSRTNTMSATGDSAPLHRVLPPGGSPPTGGDGRTSAAAQGPATPTAGSPAGGSGIPPLVLAAYLDAERAVSHSDPGCRLRWQMLAGIGEVESGQAEGGDLTADGTTRTPILGPALDGTGGNAAIPAPGGGWAHAEGPMQFLPSTWAQWGVDGNGDGVADVNNIFDAALAAGHYLCAGGRDLSTPTGLDAAILSYNHSAGYLATVTAWITYYENNPNTGSGPTGIGSGSGSGSPSASGRPSPSGSRPHPTSSPTRSGSPSPSPRPSRSATPSGSPTTSGSPTASPSGSPSSSTPACPSPTGTPSGSSSPSPSPTPTPTGTGSASPTPSPTGCPSPTSTGSPAPSGTGTARPGS